ncbi:hypothetical protein CALVIDRAFT_514364 [Calocera viscosa TUFC12733]|uniref:CHAT domain-containing protein n=1 Tax=Calocera viscosa (strain TUFC12733) TaxID=1330018 RepID=A0A167MCK1_CALVF|nr:hypothetical protein CALVIDRAFT_514364 [Calocera viscosa TUFC12733]
MLWLATVYRVRHSARGKMDGEDICAAEKFGRRAMDLSHNFRCHNLAVSTLSCILQERYYWSGTVDDIREAVRLGERYALAVVEKPWLCNMDRWQLTNIGNTCNVMVLADGRLENFRKSAGYHRLALSGATYPLGRLLYGHVHLCLSTALSNLAEESGDPRDADDALLSSFQASDHYPADGPHRTMVLHSLGACNWLLYAHNGEEKNFKAAVSYFQQVIEACKVVDVMKRLMSQCYRYLSTTYAEKFTQTGLASAIDHAINFGQLGLDIEFSEAHKPYQLSMQGELLLKRYDVTGNIEDMERSISLTETALASTVNSRYQRHILLGRNAASLARRYRAAGSPKDIDCCIKTLKEALQLYEDLSHIRRSPFLAELGAAYQARFYNSKNNEDLDAAIYNYHLGAEDTAGALKDRIHAAVAGAKFAYEVGRHSDSARSYDSAVSLLPRLAWLGLTTRSRHKRLIGSAGQLACDAAAMSIAIGNHERAVELLEEGRSVLWRSVLDLRFDTHELSEANSSLTNELLSIGKALEHDDSVSPSESIMQEEQRSARRRKLAARWDELVLDIRQLPGYESFLRPVPFHRLRQAAKNGPIVIINVSKYRTDALILWPNQPMDCIHLPELTYDAVNSLAYAWRTALSCTKDNHGSEYLDRVLLDICGRLWEGGLSRIALALQNHLPPTTHGNSGLPRVWWLPTGLLNLLPIHCAGKYNVDGSGICDLFVSSYTSTLCALLSGQMKAATKASDLPFKMLAIAQPSVSGLAFLKHAEDEMRELASSNLSSTTFVTGDDATTARFSQEVVQHQWLHCCCHGRWNAVNPLEIAFRMSDGNLSLSSLVQMRLPNAEFALLSACHTARYTAVLPDESTHLAAGMQVAGFQAVIGTQWGMTDRDGPALTRLFYDYLTRDGQRPDVSRTAEALHFALRQFRAHNVPLWRWALFVHIGI